VEYCTKCGHMVHETASACPQCGARRFAAGQPGVSGKSRLTALLLCFFLGAFGIHRFYVGKVGTGVLWLLTLGVLGIGALIDFVMIATGSFRDADGLVVLDWEGRG
jgi:TM2 domain-containing membrane protein YozV